jgi:hypothetical protein
MFDGQPVKGMCSFPYHTKPLTNFRKVPSTTTQGTCFTTGRMTSASRS